ncbi:MAG: PEGA domain-containing protein, partial [Pseudomonadota bacterium]
MRFLETSVLLVLFVVAIGVAPAPVEAQRSVFASDSTANPETRGNTLRDSGTLVLLPVEGGKKIPFLGQEISEAMIEIKRKVQTLALSLDDLGLAVSCPEPASCLQKIGRKIKASGLLLASVHEVGDRVELTLTWFDVELGKNKNKFQKELPLDPIKRKPVVLEVVRKVMGVGTIPGAEKGFTGGLDIVSTVIDVEITIDGQSRGTTPLQLRGLPVGSYEIVGERHDYVVWRGVVQVNADKVTSLEIEIVESAKDSHGIRFLDAIRVHTWIVGGVGLASLATGIVFGAHMMKQQQEFNDLPGVNPHQLTLMKQYQDTGERDAVVANVLLGVGGGLLLAAAVLSYFDYGFA